MIGKKRELSISNCDIGQRVVVKCFLTLPALLEFDLAREGVRCDNIVSTVIKERGESIHFCSSSPFIGAGSANYFSMEPFEIHDRTFLN